MQLSSSWKAIKRCGRHCERQRLQCRARWANDHRGPERAGLRGGQGRFHLKARKCKWSREHFHDCRQHHRCSWLRGSMSRRLMMLKNKYTRHCADCCTTLVQHVLARMLLFLRVAAVDNDPRSMSPVEDSPIPRYLSVKRIRVQVGPLSCPSA